jgi:hypothetical protein
MTNSAQDFPIVGEETNALLENMGLPDQESRELVLNEALEVIKQCVPPHDPSGHRTGLVCGYVQSGKTGSFTVVTALACDNNYQMVIIIGGTKTNLLNQSNDRLKRDLRLDVRPDRRWKWFESPKSNKRHNIRPLARIRRSLNQARDYTNQQ